MGEILFQLLCAIVLIAFYFVLPVIGAYLSYRFSHTEPHDNKPYHKMDK